MNWLAERLLACVLAVVLGGLAGYVFGRTVGTPVMGELLGAAIAVALLGTMETLRGYRLIQWLRGPQLGFTIRVCFRPRACSSHVVLPLFLIDSRPTSYAQQGIFNTCARCCSIGFGQKKTPKRPLWRLGPTHYDWKPFPVQFSLSNTPSL